MPAHVFLLTVLAFTLFQPDQTLRSFGAADRTWQVETLNGEPFEANATISFPGRYRVAGETPCNYFSTSNSTPYPWIELNPIAVTKRYCPEIEAEDAFLRALNAVRVVVIDGDIMVLSDENTELMVLKARD